MPQSDTSIVVIDTYSGHARDSRNWVLGRFIRDYNDRLDADVRDEEPHVPRDVEHADGHVAGAKDGTELRENAKRQPFHGLCVGVYEVDTDPPAEHGVPTLDWVWYSGLVVMAIQLGIAAVPWAVNGRWNVFLVTAAGNLMAVVGGSLSQWRSEKWACPKEGGGNVAITEGNGSRSAVVILGKRGVGLKFEVLARGTRLAPASPHTQMFTLMLALLWIVLLITVAGMKENRWCMSLFPSWSFFDSPC
jgi:hypothetical protein